MTDDDLERMAAALERSGRYEVLRQFRPLQQYAAPDGAPLATALAVDVETTGLDCHKDRIIQFSGVPFHYAPLTGQIYDVGLPLTYLEDPAVEITPDITALTNITPEQVQGRRIDDEAVKALVNSAEIVIAHNAKFDRCFLERRLPIFATKAWACSLSDVAWPMGAGSTKLEFLLYKHCGVFFSAHTAEADCLALIHLLATPFATGERPMALLLESAQRKTVRIWTTGAPFDKKDLLKARHYLWNSGENGKPKAWYRDLPETDSVAELDWLRDHIYNGRSGQWRVDSFDATQRYSERI